MHEHIPAVLATVQHVHQAAKYVPITGNDKKSLGEAGLFGGAVAGLLVVLGLARGRKPATSSN